MTDDLHGRVALVTGGSRGIGKAVVAALADAGVAVAINYRERATPADALAAQIVDAGGRAASFRADVSQAAEVAAMVSDIEAQLGAIDILVNNAGIAITRDVDDLTEADFDATIAVNLKSAFLCMRAAIPGMRARRWGRIVNVSSGAARGAGSIGPHYNASKAGLEGLTRGYAAGLVKDGITVNAVAPSLIDTEMMAGRDLSSRIPLGRMGRADEVAQAVIMVISNAYMTGQAVALSGRDGLQLTMRDIATAVTDSPLLLYTLRRADDALVLGHRLSQWCGHAPTMEEDMAMANIALDLIGQARSLYQYAAESEGAGRTEDDLAYRRDAPQYRNVLLVEQPNGDFAHTMMRQFLYSAFADPFWRATMRSSDATLAAIAAKSEKESAYHLRHCSEWIIRLGDGTDESARRVATARDGLLPYAGELFEADDGERGLVAQGVAIDPTVTRVAFDDTVETIFARAKLGDGVPAWSQTGGRRGRHTEHLGPMLAEMQHLQRAYPGAVW